MKKTIIAAACAATMAVALTGCAPAQPYGGFCDSVSGPVLSSYMALMDMAGKITLPEKKRQQAVWDNGYNTINDWIAAVDSVQPTLSTLIVSGKLTDDEKVLIERAATEVSQSTIFEAYWAGDYDWFKQTTEDLATIGGTCDR